MARIVIHRRRGPYTIAKDDTEGPRISICGCGLTATPPYCDDSHEVTKREPHDALLYYPDNDDRRDPVRVDPAALREPAQGE